MFITKSAKDLFCLLIYETPIAPKVPKNVEITVANKAIVIVVDNESIIAWFSNSDS